MKIQDTIELNGKIYPFVRDMTPKEEQSYFEYNDLSVEQQIAELKQKLADTDYKALKFAEGITSAEEYAPIKAQRQVWRAEINKLEESVCR